MHLSGVSFRVLLWFVILISSTADSNLFAAPVDLAAVPKKNLPAGAIVFNDHAVNPARVLVRWKDVATAGALASRVEQALRTENAQAFGARPTRVSADLYATLGTVGVIEFEDAASSQAALARGESIASPSAGSPGAGALALTQLKSRLAALEASGLFDYVEPDYIQHASATPADVAFTDGRLWGLRNLGQSGGVSGVDTQVVSAWDLTTGSSNVIVAVIDTGIRYTHRDLAANMWRNPGEIEGNGVDDDANGFVDDVFGINAITRSGNPLDDNGHGSHCAGTIGGTPNDIGELVGVAWTVRLMGLKFLSAQGSGDLSDSIRCIDYAIAKGAHIISGSYGGGGFSRATSDAIERARQAGILCVFAAGNESNNNETNPAYPASYPHNNIISVAAIDRTGALATFSNFGATSVDIAAPGVQIFSCNFQNDSVYQTISGTSMATPHVAGVAALLKARNFNEGYVTIRERLLGSTKPLAGLQGRMGTGGIVQARAAMDLSADNVLEVVVSVDPTPLRAGEPAVITVRVSDFAPVTNATVTGTLGTTAVLFQNDGVAPDTRAEDDSYTSRVSVPQATSGDINLAVNATAGGKNPFSGNVTLPIVARATNDNFESAAAVDLGAVPIRSTNLDCSRETGEPAHAGNTGGRSVWWTWTAPSAGETRITTTGSSFDTTLGIYTGSSLNALTGVASNDDAPGSLQSTVQFTAAAGTTYRIAVDGFNAASGDVVLNVTFTPASGTNTPPTFARQPASVRVQQGETIRLSVEVVGTPPPTLRWSFEGVALNDGGRVSGATTNELAITSAVAADAGDYRATATNAAGTATSLEATVTVDVALVRPPNDEFALRLALVGTSAQTTGNNTGATVEAGEPAHAGLTARRSVWWTWTAPETGSVAVDTFGSAFDTVLAVYRGTGIPALTSVASNDDATGSRQSRLVFAAEAGVQYAIAVDSAGTESGSITLRLLQGVAGGNPPVITRQPVDTPVLEGFGGALTVVATGSTPLTYRWWHNGSPIDGANTPVIALNESQLTDAGTYFVVVSNPFGSVTSNTITVDVTPINRPPNDDFANAAPIAFGGEIIIARLTGATRETGERNHGSPDAVGGTLWWRWSPLESGIDTISTDGSITESGLTLDTVLAVYTGSSLNNLTLVAENDDTDDSVNSAVTFNATVGTTYFIAVGGYDVDDVGIILLETPFAATGVAFAPIVLLQPLTHTGAVGDTATYIVGTGGSPNPAIRWQRSTNGGADWTDLTDGGDILGASTLILDVSNIRESQNGERYRARLSNSAGTTNSIGAMLVVLPKPPNDDFADAITIPAGLGVITGGSFGATQENNEPEHDDVGLGSVWWTWQAPFSGLADFDTVGSGFDTVLAVYTGTAVGALNRVASNDDFGDSRQSRVEFTATAGTIYRIAVSGYSGDFGSVVLGAPTDLGPSLTLQPPGNSQVTNGGTVTLSAGATGSPPPSFQWQRSINGGASWTDISDNATFAGTTTQILSITGATNALNGHLFRVIATNSGGSVTSSASTLVVTNPLVQVMNLSTRTVSLGGDSVIIPGFVISGTSAKRVLIRAVGPKLADFGVSGVMPDPVLSVFRQGESTSLATNDNWVTQEAGRLDPAVIGLQVGAFELTDDSLSAALVLDLAAGAYSTIARDSLDRTGIGLVEVYDVDNPNTGGPRLINVSNRGVVRSGTEVMIPGFVVEGSGARRYMIRAVGPKLLDFGLAANTLLADPQISVMKGLAEVAANDDWVVQATGAGGTSADVQTIAQQIGAFALGPDATFTTNDQKSAALILWLEPGAYTVVVSGVGGGTGVALAEVYEVP